MPKGFYARNQRSGVTAADRLSFYTDRSGGPDACWLWKGSPYRGRYGSVRWNGRAFQAHRLAWEVATGRAVPSGMVICHRCDAPRCVNPAHLFIGTQQENIADMLAKKRNRHPKGERHPFAKLTANNIKEIRASADTQVALASRFSVTQATISAILTRKTWTHV